MTVHASKGLEFPIVFVVNLAKGASGFPRPVRVSGEEVSVGPFVSESDDEERFREREETKRLIYVALTRARDRLYLGTVLKDGAFAIGRGSLAEVLPESFRALFVRAAQEPGDVDRVDGRSQGRAYRVRSRAEQSSASGGSRAASNNFETSTAGRRLTDGLPPRTPADRRCAVDASGVDRPTSGALPSRARPLGSC